MTGAHIRLPIRPKRGNSFYRDKDDKPVATLCGAAVTDRDVSYAYAKTEGFRRHVALYQHNFPLCADCVELKRGETDGQV